LCPRSNDFDHITEEVLDSVDGKVKNENLHNFRNGQKI
jgi:hypothetical protein